MTSDTRPYVVMPVMGDVAGIEANSAAGDHVVNNLQTDDPTNTWRTDGTSPAQVDIDLGAPREWNLVGFTETNASATSKNLMPSTDAMTSAPWFYSASTVMTRASDESPLGDDYPGWRMTLTGPTSSVATRAYQTGVTLPANVVGSRVSMSVWGKVESGDAGGFFLRVSRGGADFYIYYNGTATAGSSSGSLWSGFEVDAEAFPDGWVRLWGSALYLGVDAGPFDWEVMGDDGGENLTWSAGGGTHAWLFYRPTLTLGRDTKPYDGLFYSAGSAAQMRVYGATSQAALTSGPSFDSGWVYACRDLDYRDSAFWLAQVATLYGLETPRRDRWLRIQITDPDNPDGYFQAGRLWVDNAWRPPGSYNPQASYGADEPILEKEVEGGGPFRRTFRRRNRSSLVFDYLSEAEAFDDGNRIKRIRGMSEDVLVIPSMTLGHSESQMVHGYIDSFDPPVNRTGTIFQIAYNMKGI